MKTILSIAVVIGMTVALFGFGPVFFQDEPWVVPANASKMKNPVAADDENVNWGKSLYSKHCKSCHGKAGEGDGTKAEELDTYPGDFTTAEFQKQSDGALFYKTTEGRKDMPSFRKKIPNDEDVWAVIHFMRTLKVE